MKKVGIITHYYKSKNYGGVLQAYALVEFLKSKGFDAQQLCYKRTPSKSSEAVKLRNFKRALISAIAQKFLIIPIKKGLDKRNQSFDDFTQSIPHSKKVYTDKNIYESTHEYDAFITGSDQVWNPIYYSPSFFLEFADGKNRISYAASIAHGNLSDNDKQIFKNHLKKFKAISLRENDVDLISSLTSVPVTWVIDPTMLLTSNEWDKVSSPRLIKEKYLFCYFLGRNDIQRKVATEFAKKHHLKVVTIPHLMGMFERSDAFFGDIKVLDASPADFISLIKHAEYVFADSFHATAFSNIYNKQYFVFHRSGFKGMASRIYSICELFGTQSRFLDTPEKTTLLHIEETLNKEKGASSNKEKFAKKKALSEKFLLDALGD